MYIGNDPSATTNNAGNNVAIGITALDRVTTGAMNTAIGSEALSENTDGAKNTAVGYSSLSRNVGGDENTAIGYQALWNSRTGKYNTAVGSEALFNSSSGWNNTAVGQQALRVSTATGNTVVGYRAALANSSGGDNTALGFKALDTVTVGTANTVIGSQSDVGANNLTNATAIGYGAIVNDSNTMQLGNTSTTNIKTSGTITAGAITIPNNDGTASQVLKTNGSGALSWATLSSGTTTIASFATTSDVDIYSDSYITISFDYLNQQTQYIYADVNSNPASGNVQFVWDSSTNDLDGYNSITLDDPIELLSRIYMEANHAITIYSPLDNNYPYYEIKIARAVRDENLVIRVTKWSSM